MTLFDYAVLTITGFSVLLGVVRGLVREVIVLASWIVAFFVASLYSVDVAQMLVGQIDDESWRMLAAFVTVFITTLIAMSVIALILVKLVHSAGLGVEDRLFGGLFGLARGVLLVLVLMLLAGFTGLPRQPLWKDAMLSGPLQSFASQVKQWLPQDWAKHISY